MRQVAYNVLSATPSRIGGFLGLGVTSWSAGDPESFKAWWGWAMTSEHIRVTGIIGIGVFGLYWAALLLLRPKGGTEKTRSAFIKGDFSNLRGCVRTLT